MYSDPESLGFEELLADSNDRSRPEFADAKIILSDIMLRLPTKERIVVDMYYKRNMNKQEIAKTLQISKTSVTRRMNQAFEMISSLILNEVESDKIKKGNLLPKDL
jgi:RNA polymerase sigma factor (sigma-70 family)